MVSAWAVHPGGPGVALRGRLDSESPIPSPRLQIASIQGDVLAMPPPGFLQGPGRDLGRAGVMAPAKDKGRARGTWALPPLKPEKL